MQLRLSQTRIVTFGGRGAPSADDIEMSVEGCDLVDLRHRQSHQLGEAVEMPCGQALFGILNCVQVFDQERALVGARTQEPHDGVDLGLLQDPALREEGRRSAPSARMQPFCCHR